MKAALDQFNPSLNGIVSPSTHVGSGEAVSASSEDIVAIFKRDIPTQLKHPAISRPILKVILEKFSLYIGDKGS